MARLSDNLRRVQPLARLQKTLSSLRRGKKVVLTNGVFDLLHLGHVTYLEKARRLGDLLVVAVNGDESVRALKGPTRPVHPEAARAGVLAALRCVDYCTIFHDLRVTDVILTIRPDVYVKGGDYTVGSLNPQERRALKEVGARVKILPMVEGYSTTAALRKIFQEVAS
ncbi:MAG: adenylyltransferase/cytidyltransferase family protein [Verrucomicrobiae bacterium]|nr:adenylyltransferase/cytidyltransferase family protein [Verrucomicrobiae bacterium]